MLVLSDRIETLLQRLGEEGLEYSVIGPEDAKAYQTRLRTQGFDAQELETARAIA
jgi:hypothetical protein